MGRMLSKSAAVEAAKAPLKDDAASFNDDSYYKSLDTFYALKTTAKRRTYAAAAGESEPWGAQRAE